MLDIGREIELPKLPHEVAFIVEMLFEAGPVTSSGDGSIPLTWQALTAWQDALGVSLPLWQLRLLRKLSLEYLSQHRAAAEPDAPMPWKTTTTPSRRAKVADNVRGILRG